SELKRRAVPGVDLSRTLPSFEVPATNAEDVRAHLAPFVSKFVELAGGKIRGINICGNGSDRGWKLFVIARENLSQAETSELLRIALICFRQHDDPWFHEHCSPT